MTIHGEANRPIAGAIQGVSRQRIRSTPARLVVGLLIGSACLLSPAAGLNAGSRDVQLVVTLKNAENVIFLGAVNRWDKDGNPRRPVDPKASIGQPKAALQGKKLAAGRWGFTDLPAGRYDLVILTATQVRIEGFHYPPILDFDSVLPADQQAAASAADWIKKQISTSRHYENKVAPLYLGGDKKQVRVLVQLLRDKPTSFDRQFGRPVATLRHEIWQYTHRYGAWSKEKRTRVLDRVLMAKRDLRKWTWIWEPKLGGIEVSNKAVVVDYELPQKIDAGQARGLLPY